MFASIAKLLDSFELGNIVDLIEELFRLAELCARFSLLLDVNVVALCNPFPEMSKTKHQKQEVSFGRSLYVVGVSLVNDAVQVFGFVQVKESGSGHLSGTYLVWPRTKGVCQ